MGGGVFAATSAKGWRTGCRRSMAGAIAPTEKQLLYLYFWKFLAAFVHDQFRFVGDGKGEIETETDRQTDRDRETETDRDRQTDRQTDRDRQKERQTETESKRETETQRHVGLHDLPPLYHHLYCQKIVILPESLPSDRTFRMCEKKI